MEDFTVETWEAVLRRLSLSRGRVLGTSTLYVLGWLKTEVYDRWIAGDPQFEVVQFQSSLNPAFPPEEQERARLTMPAWRYQMFYEGQFARPAGMIYDCFDEEIHVVEPFEIPPSWPRYAGVDFGGANTAVVWVAEDIARQRYFLYAERLDGNKTTREHARESTQLAGGGNIVACWGGAKSEGQFRTDWTEAGLHVKEPPVKDVESGINRVYGLLKQKRLFIFRDCRGVRDQFGSYRRKLNPSGEATEVIEDKRSYHYLDSCRYLACGLVRAPAGRPLAAGQRILPPGYIGAGSDLPGYLGGGSGPRAGGGGAEQSPRPGAPVAVPGRATHGLMGSRPVKWDG